jgi:hypothetical protein
VFRWPRRVSRTTLNIGATPGKSKRISNGSIGAILDSMLNTVSVEPDEKAPVEKTAEAAPVAQN